MSNVEVDGIIRVREIIHSVEVNLELAEKRLRELKDNDGTFFSVKSILDGESVMQAAEEVTNLRVGVVGIWFKTLSRYEKKMKNAKAL